MHFCIAKNRFMWLIDNENGHNALLYRYDDDIWKTNDEIEDEIECIEEQINADGYNSYLFCHHDSCEEIKEEVEILERNIVVTENNYSR